MSPLPGTIPSLQRRQQDQLMDRQIYPRQTAAPQDDWRFTFLTLDGYSIQPPKEVKEMEALINPSFKNTIPYYLKEVSTYAASTAYKDKMILRYFLSYQYFSRVDSQVWTFKDDAWIFQAITNIEICPHQPSGNAVKWYYYRIL